MHCGKGNRKSGQGSVKYRKDSGHVSGKQKFDGIFDIAEYIPAIGNSFDDCRKIIVCQNHGGGVFGHFCSGDSHGDTDICSLQGRSVIDAVTGHGNNLSLFLPRIDDPDLIARGYTGIHTDVLQLLIQLFIAHGIDFRSGKGQVALMHNADPLCDG